MAVQAQLERPALGFLWDHTVQGRTILPGAAMCEMAVAAGKVRTLAAFPSVHHSARLTHTRVYVVIFIDWSFSYIIIWLLPVHPAFLLLCPLQLHNIQIHLQVLFGMETVECEVALTSAAIPAPMVLDLASNPVATLRVNLHTGMAEVRLCQHSFILCMLPSLLKLQSCFDAILRTFLVG